MASAVLRRAGGQGTLKQRRKHSPVSLFGIRVVAELWLALEESLSPLCPPGTWS